MSGAVSVQMQYHDMEFIDTIDKLTLIYGDCKDKLLPYTGGRHNRQPIALSYTEEVDE